MTKKIANRHIRKGRKTSSSRKGLISSILAWTILFGSSSLIIFFGWLSILFILDPMQLIWINDFLPKWAAIPTEKKDLPLTLNTINNSIIKKQLTPGKIIYLDGTLQKLFLLPILDNQKIVELRIYQTSQDLAFRYKPEKYYNLVSQLSLFGVAESFVNGNINNVDQEFFDSENQEEEIYLPLITITPFNDSKQPGYWFILQGEKYDNNIKYGQIIYYNPLISKLEKMIFWKTSNGNLPKWEEVTGGGMKELLIDQSMGIEPQFEVYQIKPNELVDNSIYLQFINLKKPAISLFGYQQSLLLARNGLWTPALTWLNALQKQAKKPFPSAVQAQVDVIRLHSQVTRSEADKNWASINQRVTTYIMDGRWEQALDIFTASKYHVEEISNLLKSDKGRIWNRATVALRLNNNRRAVLAWMALLFRIQRGEERANAWLQEQKNITVENLSYIQSILDKLDGNLIDTHPSQIIGTVKKVDQINKYQWLSLLPLNELFINTGQVWYELDVNAFNDGTTWLYYPFKNFDQFIDKPRQFWRQVLGINSDQTMQVISWNSNGKQEVTEVTIKAVQVSSQNLRLLMSGKAITDIDKSLYKPLGLTKDALKWVKPDPISVTELNQQNSQLTELILPAVWLTLQESGDISEVSTPLVEEMRQKMADWAVQLIDVNNDGKQELLFSISREAIANLNILPRPGVSRHNQPSDIPRTLILTQGGKVIYNDFASKNQQTLTAIAQLKNDQSLALLVEGTTGYSLLHWSKVEQSFK